ncbi:MAG: MerR family transcriptional regulator [Candidatus Izemoplasmatales bacterium]
MEYTITDLARLSGVSTRTLRYYDAIGLLKPWKTGSGGIRLYGDAETDRLRQILFYRELDVPLADIRRIVAAKGFDPVTALAGHRRALLSRRDRLDALITTIDAELDARGKGESMKNDEKFAALKKRQIAENEKAYGSEVRAAFGSATIDEANARYEGMDRDTYAKMDAMSADVIRLLLAAMDDGDVRSDAARRLVRLHRDWLMLFWTSYSPEAHKGLADAYVDDPRFAAYYDRHRPGAAVFLRDAIKANV